MRIFLIVVFFVGFNFANAAPAKPKSSKPAKVASNSKLSPGQWYSEANFQLNGIPMPSTSDDSCVTKDEVNDPKKAIAESLKRNDCQLLEWSLVKKNVAARVSCKNSQYSAEGKISGTFSEEKYFLTGAITGVHQMLGQAEATVQFKGTRTGECKTK